jgi:hypothetical protein
MKIFKLIVIPLIFISILFTSCEEQEDPNPIENNNSSGNSGGWSNGYWLRSSSGTYLDLTESKPVFCANGAIVGGTYSALAWTNADEAFFTLFNNGDERKFKIEKSGSNLILSPWDEAGQQTNNPTTYTPTGTFPCNSSISCTYSGEDVVIWPLALLSGDRRVGKPIEFFDRVGWVSYDCHATNYWDFGDGTTGTTTGRGGRIEHTYSSPGTYVITLVATSTEGVTSTATRELGIL